MTIEDAKQLVVGDIVESSYLAGFDDEDENFGEVVNVNDVSVLVNWADGIEGIIDFSSFGADVLKHIEKVA